MSYIGPWSLDLPAKVFVCSVYSFSGKWHYITTGLYIIITQHFECNEIVKNTLPCLKLLPESEYQSPIIILIFTISTTIRMSEMLQMRVSVSIKSPTNISQLVLTGSLKLYILWPRLLKGPITFWLVMFMFLFEYDRLVDTNLKAFWDFLGRKHPSKKIIQTDL